MKFPTPNLNAYFKNIVPSKGIISVWGDFGVGKTTFALQTAINNAINGKKSLYFYTKPNFPAEKIEMLFKDSLDFLDKIEFVKPINFYDLTAIVFNLEFLILKNFDERKEPLKLIVIDSLTDLYRLELNREKKEKNYNLNYHLNQVLATLSYINDSYSIEVLIINEKRQKRNLEQIIELQSGGKVMKYWVSYDIKIERTNILNERKFVLTIHPEEKILFFTIKLTERGFE